jgi:hypothetical protein
MKHIWILLLSAHAYAGTNITTNTTGFTLTPDNAITQTQLDAAVAKVLAAIKAIPACTGTTTPPVVTPPVVTPPVVTPPPPTGDTGIYIGTKMYNSLADAAGNYKSGDTVLIKKDLDNQCGAFTTGDVNIVCSPGVKLTWSAGLNLRPCWGKGFLVFEGTTTSASVKNCEMSGMVLAGPSGGNAAGIRGSLPLANLTVDNVYVHDSNNGILGGGYTKTVITNSKFIKNGLFTGGTANVHDIYIDAVGELVVDKTYFGPVTPANFLKSRAKKNTITNSVFESKSDVGGSYLIDLPNGGESVVKNNVFVKAPNQPQRFLFSYGVEGYPADGRVNTYEFTGNLVVSDMSPGAFINWANGGVSNFHDNVLVGNLDQVNVPLSNTKFFADRASAGLAPAPALPALLTPAAAPMSMMGIKKAAPAKK